MSKAPPTPCTGSTITAAVARVTCAAMASGSRRGMKLTSNGVRGKPYHLPAAPQVIAPAPAVRPWNACSMATTCVRPVIVNAIFSAFSFASAPLLTKNTRAMSSPEKRTRRAAARSRTSSGTALLWKLNERACRASASVQPGWPYPSAATAWPP